MEIRKALIFVTIFFVSELDAFIARESRKGKSVIIDVDSGVDDYQGLVYLLNAEKREEVVIKAIVLTDGNTELPYVKNNVYRLLEIVGRTTIPVYAGAAINLLGHKKSEHWYGLDGFGDLGLGNPSLRRLSNVTAPTAIAWMVRNNPGRITYIALGPLTNLAIAFRLYPDIIDKLQDIYIMGGNYNDENAEFNFLTDPESVHIVIATAAKPVNLFTFQACKNKDMTLAWRWTVQLNNPVWNINEKAERKLFHNNFPPEFLYNSCDPITVATFLNPSLIIQPSHLVHADIGLGVDDRAKVIVSNDLEPKNVLIIQGFDAEAYQRYYIKQFADVCKLYKCSSKYEKI